MPFDSHCLISYNEFFSLHSNTIILSTEYSEGYNIVEKLNENNGQKLP